jgi:molybdopterin molybdotransferase
MAAFRLSQMAMTQHPAPLNPAAAQRAIEAETPLLPTQRLPLADCIGLTLRQDVYAERDNPPFDRVCMDGIAVSSAIVAGGVRRFPIEAMHAAGAPSVALQAPSHALEVTTGAILPQGTDCIIPLEEYDLDGGIAVLKDTARGAPYRNVQRRGEDSERGVPMLRAGVRLGAPEIAVAASAGLAAVEVSRQPRFIVISTGDELVEPGQPIAAHQVRRSNAYAIIAALRTRGFQHIGNDHLADEESVLTERLSAHLAQREVLVLSGGVSKGKFDLVPKVLKQIGVREVFYQVAQRPGMPMWFGAGPAQQLVFGLPGNPVATLVCLIRYVLPAAFHSMGTHVSNPEHIALAAAVGRGRAMTYYLPIAITLDARGGPVAQPKPTNGPGDFLGLTGTDGFVELPPAPQGFPEGFIAPLHRW